MGLISFSPRTRTFSHFYLRASTIVPPTQYSARETKAREHPRTPRPRGRAHSTRAHESRRTRADPGAHTHTHVHTQGCRRVSDNRYENSVPASVSTRDMKMSAPTGRLGRGARSSVSGAGLAVKSGAQSQEQSPVSGAELRVKSRAQRQKRSSVSRAELGVKRGAQCQPWSSCQE